MKKREIFLLSFCDWYPGGRIVFCKFIRKFCPVRIAIFEIPSYNEKECLDFKNNILKLLYSSYFEIDDKFVKEHIYNDRDKDLMAYKEDFDFLVCCKYRSSRKIGFNDVERVFLLQILTIAKE
ncbi:hypothetical protein Glove_7g50 [Diversispora epigaea]|uniref:Uncharacterized protein n=1 Tax=Diversispora epigaea TaxID=1348612 RepID=A0A397JXY0_9GLOM|nr:hypothetical protein Glove_7g50 [Diversispora epigaea]